MPNKSSTPSVSTKPTVVDLFCGAGGFSEGFRAAGYRVLAGIDNDPQALLTYAHNFPEATVFLHDLSKEPAGNREISEIVKTERVDVVVGGPPCQGFSLAGKRSEFDPRNKLYVAYFHFIQMVKPKAVVIENVPTMFSLYGGKVADAIFEGLESCGYNVQSFVLSADNYGVPQKRRRAFVIATKTLLYQAPGALPSPSLTCWDAISDLPLLDRELGREKQTYRAKPKTDYQRLMRNGSECLLNHSAVQHTDETKRIIAMVPDGGNYKSLPSSLWKTRKVNIAWTRMNSKKPCFTIDAGHNHHFHYRANRVPTVRECARIQSFPDRFLFLGNRTSQYRQVGNAVPPLLAKAVALSLQAHVRS
jgi:DNA (cytosine-5)-methyltransferase 1